MMEHTNGTTAELVTFDAITTAGPTQQATGYIPEGWFVRDARGGAIVGSIEWHDALGAYGFAAAPGLPFAAEVLEEVGRFVDRENAEASEV